MWSICEGKYGGYKMVRVKGKKTEVAVSHRQFCTPVLHQDLSQDL